MEQRESTLGERILMARMELSADMGEKISQEILGMMAARYLRRDEPITGATVSRWEAGETVPSLETVEAVAVACGVDPGWLAFGNRSRAPGPRDRITDPELRQWRAANVGILLEREAEQRIERVALRRSRDWYARHNRLVKEQRSIRRIKDPAEREARDKEWKAAFEALNAELDQIHEETERLSLEAAALPRQELEKEKARQQRKGPPRNGGDT